MKNVKKWGVELTSLQEMMFSKYIDNNSIAPNTMTKDERVRFLNEWKSKQTSV